MTHSLTIGVVPRERFSSAPGALTALLANTPEPYELLVVDPGIPEPWRTELAEILASRPGARMIEGPADGRPLLPNRARNLVLQHASVRLVSGRAGPGHNVCLLENDVLVHEGWLPPLLDAMDEAGAGVAVPLILERFGSYEKVHFDDRLHRIVDHETDNGIERTIEARPDSKEDDRQGTTRAVDFIETHCMLFRSEALDRLGGFDGSITAQEEIDISFGLHAAGIERVFVPSSVVTFLPPPPIHPAERAYYLSKWNPETYEVDEETMKQRWGIVGYPSAVGVLEARRAMADGSVEDQIRIESEHRAGLEATRRDLAPLVERGPLILVHGDQLDLSLVCPGADVRPFLERDGLWWGPPADSAQAIEELERMRTDGATTIALAAGSWWWLDTYEEFAAHLNRSFPELTSTDQIKAFDISPIGEAGR